MSYIRSARVQTVATGISEPQPELFSLKLTERREP